VTTDPDAAERLALTARWERWRARCSGPAAATVGGLMLVVAVQHFVAPDAAKAVLASAASCGFLASPLAVQAAARRGWRVAEVMSGLLMIGAAGFALAAIASGITGYVAGFLIALVAIGMMVPFTITLWRQNSGDAVRGRHFSAVVQNEVVAGLVATLLIAWWIGQDASRFRPVLALVAVASTVAGLCVRRVPSQPLPPSGRNPFAPLAWLWRDRGFGWVNCSYTVMGFANFMILPLRVDWLASPEHGLGHRADVIQLVVVAVPTLMRFAFGRAWGAAFDRMNFIALRLAINACFVAAMALFFTASLPLQVVASAFLGLGFAGGDIAWNLWVTKYAPPERTADYMTVHVFLTGARGLAAPSIGFALVAGFGRGPVGWLAIAGVVVASLMLLPELRRFARPPA
jgi:MFS family permease